MSHALLSTDLPLGRYAYSWLIDNEPKVRDLVFCQWGSRIDSGSVPNLDCFTLLEISI